MLRTPDQDAAMSIELRRATPEDRDAVYAMFRRSIWAYLRQVGVVGAEDDEDPKEAWRRQRATFVHTETTAAEDWLAADGDRVVGMARSIERDGHLQLTHFFVDPDAQAGGVGRRLLARAFPPDRGSGRSILATQHPRALSLYLRSGVAVRSVAATFLRRPERMPLPAGAEVAPVGEGEVADLERMDRDILGFARPEDLRFLASDRPASLLVRDGRPFGYAFTSNGELSGPAGARSAADLPGVLAVLEDAAFERGQDEHGVLLSLEAHEGVRWLLDRGYRLAPFYEFLLVDAPTVAFDRYVMTQPSFLW